MSASPLACLPSKHGVLGPFPWVWVELYNWLDKQNAAKWHCHFWHKFRKGPSASADLSREPQPNGTSQVALVVKNLPINAEDIRDMCSIPGLGRLPGEGHGNLIQYSCLEKFHGHIRRFSSSEANMWGGHSERLERKILIPEEFPLFRSQLVKS